MKKDIKQITTEGHVSEQIAFIILCHYFPTYSVDKIRSASHDLSNKIRAGINAVEEDKIEISDTEANSLSFLCNTIVQSGKDFNKITN